MRRKSILAIVLATFLTVVPHVSAADIVLNEFVVNPSNAQWVELYNKGTSTVDISNWIIDDNGGTEKFIIPQGTSIAPGEFKIFEGNAFNFNPASGDEAKLVQDSTIIDSYTYSSGLSENVSFGRSVDGAGSWYSFSSPTKGSSNNTATPLPTATPMPTATPEPTKAPTSTKSPSPTKEPTPTKLTPTAKLSPTLEVSKESTKNNEDEELASDDAESSQRMSVLSDTTTIASPSPTPTQVHVAGKTSLGAYFILAGGGVLIACAILAFYSRKKLLEQTI